MADYLDISRDYNAACAELLLTDLAVANTFMDVAETTHDLDTVRRNHRNARKAYDTIVGFLPRLVLSDATQEEFSYKLEALRARLIAAGCPL